MTTYLLKAQSRELKGKKVNKLREESLIPAVVYGEGVKNQNLTVTRNEFLKILDQAGYSSLIDLQIGDSKPVKILIQDYQKDPKTDQIIHVDFHQIKEGKKITTEMELEFIGEAPAVKELGGIFMKNFNAVEIECLPKDLELLENIKVDLSVLKTYSDAIHIKNLQVPSQIKILQSPDEVVALVTPPAEEKEEITVQADPETVIPEDEAVKEEEKTQEESSEEKK